MKGSVPSPSTEPGLVRRKSLIGVRTACEQMWGSAGIDGVARALPQAVRDRTAGFAPLTEWLPLDDLIAWHVAVWKGPAKQSWEIMGEFARITVDQGFGRVKRIVVSALSPQMLAQRVGPLWQDEYSTGKLEALTIEANLVKLRLSGHVYVSNPLMGNVISEAYRHVLSMTRARSVQETHEARAGALLVTLRWS